MDYLMERLLHSVPVAPGKFHLHVGVASDSTVIVKIISSQKIGGLHFRKEKWLILMIGIRRYSLPFRFVNIIDDRFSFAFYFIL